MNAERLLAHYEKIADAPDAIARLRRFILELAVLGKVVPQDASEEPAAELLKRIAKEKARTGKREKGEAETANVEELGVLPLSWQAAPLIALGSWAIGSGFPKNEQGLKGGPHFFLKVSDMNLPGNEKYITTSNNYIDDEAARRLRAKIHPPGTIIFPKIGGAIATNKRRILTRGSAIDNNCLGITLAAELNVDWAFLLLTALDFAKYQAGTAVPALQQSVLERISVWVPPIAEQQRIVAKVDELMELCDRLESARIEREAARDRLAAASLARLNAPDAAAFQADARFTLEALPTLTTRPDQIKALRQTILNLAVRGKLVPQDPRDEPATELFWRIAREKAKSTGRNRPLPDIEDPEKTFDIPATWQWARMGNIFSIRTGFAFKSSTYADEGTLVFRVTNFDRSGHLDLSDVVFYPTELIDSRMSGFLLEPGEVIMVMVGGTIGKTTVVDESLLPALLNQNMWRIRSFGRIMPSAFEYLLVKNISESIRGITQSTHGHFAMSDYERRVFPLPPLAEQHRIVDKVNELMALCDRLEASLTTGAATRSRLLESLLAEALEPALVQELQAAE